MREVTNEDIKQWENLVRHLVKGFYANDILDKEDLHSIGLMGLFKGLRSYDETVNRGNGQAKKINYLSKVIKNEINTAIIRMTSKGKDEGVTNTSSIDIEIPGTEGLTIASTLEYENKVIPMQEDFMISEELEEYLLVLNELDREIVILKMRDYSFKEIGEMKDRKMNYIVTRHRRALEKMQDVILNNKRYGKVEL